MISLLHPSRSRPQKSRSTAKEWYGKINHSVRWELKVCVDYDDPYFDKYSELYFPELPQCYPDYHPFESHITIYRNDGDSVVSATNTAAKNSKGDILVYLSDDFKCPDNWAVLVEKEFEGVTEPMLLKVDDCLQDFHVPVVTIPIMNRALYNKLGYFWHPEYKSMFCDCDLFETCKRLGVIKYAKHLKFPHEHHSIGKAQNDETYRRSEANWNQGLEIFNRRKKQNFPI